MTGEASPSPEDRAASVLDAPAAGGLEAPAASGLDALYARIPRLECRKLCGHACGPIVAPEEEWLRLAAAGGEREGGDGLACPYLDREAGLCEAYEARPLICRLWGVAESLPCPHGCEPERRLGAAETEALLAEAIARSGGRVRSAWRGWERMLAAAARGGDGEGPRDAGADAAR